MTRARDESGLVLLLVLVVITLTIGTVLAFARTSLLEVSARQHRTDRTRAELLARSGLALGVRAVQDDQLIRSDEITSAIESPLDPWALLGQQVIDVPGGGELRVTVQDAGERLNLNALVDADGEPHDESRLFLVAALERIIEHMPGRPEDKLYEPDEIAGAILDWIDRNDVTRLGDEEQGHYAGVGAESGPGDRPIFALEELLAVPGIDAPLLVGLRAYFTPMPPFPQLEKSGVNPNTAPAHVLSLIYQGTSGEKQLLGRDEVFAILRARREGRIFCPASTEEPCVSFQSEIGDVGETVFPPLGFGSDVFSIRSEARFFDSRACITTVIDRRSLQEIRTLSYRMDC